MQHNDIMQNVFVDLSKKCDQSGQIVIKYWKILMYVLGRWIQIDTVTLPSNHLIFTIRFIAFKNIHLQKPFYIK